MLGSVSKNRGSSIRLTQPKRKPAVSLSSIINENEKSRNDDDSDASITVEELMSVVDVFPQDEPVDQSGSSMACCASLSSSMDTLHTATVIAISPHELCRRMIKKQQREAQRTQAGKMRVNEDMPTLEEYISKTRPPENAGGHFGLHQRSRSEISVRDTQATNRHRQRSNSVGEVSDLSSHPSSHPSPSTRENESVSLFENTSETTDTIRPKQKCSLLASFIGEETSSQLELFATDTLPALEFLGNNSDRSIELEMSHSDLFDRSATAMIFEDIIQNDLTGDARNRSVGLQRSQSELFARGTKTSNRRRRSNSVNKLSSRPRPGTKNATSQTEKGRRVSPSLKHYIETANKSERFGDSADGDYDKDSHKHQARGRQIKRQQTSVRGVAAGKAKRDKEHSTRKIKKIVAKTWKSEDDTLVGESRQIDSKIRSRNTKRRESERRSRRCGKSRIDDRRKEWSRSKSNVGENPNESERFSTETSGRSWEEGCPIAIGSDLAMYITSRARNEFDDFNAQTDENSLPTIWNDDPKCAGTDVDSLDSDGVDSDLSPRASSQVRNLSKVDGHTPFSEQRFAPNWKGTKVAIVQGLGFSCTEDDSSSFEGDPRMNERAHDSGVFVQFDANQEGHVCHIRPDMATASGLQIQHGDGSLMEGCIFRMPKTKYNDEETPDITNDKPVLSTRSSQSSSARGFLFRRHKSVRARWAEAMADPPCVGLSKMENQAHFDDLGRIEFSPNGLHS